MTFSSDKSHVASYNKGFGIFALIWIPWEFDRKQQASEDFDSLKTYI